MTGTISKMDTQTAVSGKQGHSYNGNWPEIGIGKLFVESPQTYFSHEDIGKILSKDPNHVKNGFLVNKVRLPVFSQGNVTTLANLIYKFVMDVDKDEDAKRQLFEEPISCIRCCSESGGDEARPEVMEALALVGYKLLADDEERFRPYVEMFRNARPIGYVFACKSAGDAQIDAVTDVKLSIDRHNASPNTERVASELVLAVDGAYYGNNSGGEVTQGSAGVLAWIKRDPELAAYDYWVAPGSYNVPLTDFVKFFFDDGPKVPLVQGKCSKERAFPAVSGKAAENIERRYDDLMGKISAISSHSPYGKQVIYSAAFGFGHELKESDRRLHGGNGNDDATSLYENVQSKIGRDPLGGSGFTERFEDTLRNFRGNIKHFGDYLNEDKGMSEYWNWLTELRKTPEFTAFLRKYHINDSLKYNSNIGNGYSAAQLINFAGILKVPELWVNGIGGKQKRILTITYGSGAGSDAFVTRIVANMEAIGKHLHVSLDDAESDIRLNVDSYNPLHEMLIRGEAGRTVTDEDLVGRSLELLRGRLPEGFHFRNRNPDGTCNGVVYISNMGNGGFAMHALKPRF